MGFRIFSKRNKLGGFKKFVSVIALIGALSNSACQKSGLTDFEEKALRREADTIVRKLEAGEVIGEYEAKTFVELLAKVERKKDIPPNLEYGIKHLDAFYKIREELYQKSIPIYDLEKMQKLYRNPHTRAKELKKILEENLDEADTMLEELRLAEKMLGVRLIDERLPTERLFIMWSDILFYTIKAYDDLYLTYDISNKPTYPGPDFVILRHVLESINQRIHKAYKELTKKDLPQH